MSTIYYAETHEPTRITWGLPSKGQLLSHVAKTQAAIEREVQSRYKCEPAKNMTYKNANMGRRKEGQR